MIKSIFADTQRFTIVFFVILLIDVFVKLYLPVVPYRYITKPLVILLLLGYYYINKTGKNKRQHLWVLLGLICFLMGDILIINHTNVVFMALSLLFFSIGKIFFCIKFSHKKDFDIVRLIPFSIIMFLYSVFVISLVFRNLNNFMVPVLLSFFLSLLLFQFAFLRKNIHNKMSYIYVFFGVMIFIISESIMAIKTFRQDLPLQDFLIMTLYGIAMYLIVLGIISGQKNETSIFLDEPYIQ